MDRKGRPRPSRLLAVLALLLGLLAMHGLVTGHHASALVATAVPVAGADGEHHLPTAGGLPGGRHATATAHGPASPVGPSAPLADQVVVDQVVVGQDSTCGHCPDAATVALCLAVLSAALAVLARLLARRGGRIRLPAPPVRLPRPCAGPLMLPRPPDLVAGLCVSRT